MQTIDMSRKGSDEEQVEELNLLAAALAECDCSPSVVRDDPWADIDIEDIDDETGTDTAIEPERDEIEVTTDEAAVNTEVVTALARHPSLFQRGGSLVHIAEGDDGRPVIRRAPKAVVRHCISQVATFVQEVETKDSTVRKDARPPAHAIDYACDAGEWPGVRRLDSLAPHPVILPNGEIVSVNGYEPTTRTYIHLPDLVRVDICTTPTQAEAQTAAAKLLELLTDFPFAGESHKSSWLAGLLTPLAMTLYDGPAPMFVFDANSPAVGKGKLADMIGVILTGSEMGKTPYPTAEEEMAKAITSIALAGRKVVLFDNVAGSLGCPSLELALTSTTWTKRLLGENRDYDGPLRVTWYATSNNATIESDTFRRVQLARLVTELERPHERSGFKFPNIIQHVRQHRGEYLSAAFTILKAFILAGRPQTPLPAFGSYEEWSGVVRQAVVYAGLHDPRESCAEMVTERDESLSRISAVMDAIEKMDTGRGVTSAALGKRAKEDRSGLEWVVNLQDALTEMCRKPDYSDLGYKLRPYKDAVVGGRQLKPSDAKQKGAAAYTVVKIGRLNRPLNSMSKTTNSAGGWPDDLDARLLQHQWTYRDAAEWLNQKTAVYYDPDDGDTSTILKDHRAMLLKHLTENLF